MAKLGLSLTLFAVLFFSIELSAFGQVQSGDLVGGASMFILERSPISGGKSPQIKPRQTKRRTLVSGKKNTPPPTGKKTGGKKPAAAADEPIAPDEWINENAAYAIEERRTADGEPLLFLSKGFLNSHIKGCSASVFPAAARKAKLKKVRLQLSVTLAKYGGVLDAKAIEGDAMFRQSVYNSLGNGMAFEKSYFMGEPVRIQGLLEFTQHDSDSYNMISCRDAVTEAELPSVIDGGALNEYAASCETPEFPADAKAAGLKSVEAQIQVIVDEQGKVASAKVINGQPTFAAAAAKSVMSLTFPKSSITGSPVRVQGVMIFTQNPNNDALCKNTTGETK